MKRSIVLLALSCTGLFSCSRGEKTSAPTEDHYEKMYTIGEIPGLDDFLTFNQAEKQMDSLYQKLDHELDSLEKQDAANENFLPERDFKNNRGRIYSQAFKNGKKQEGELHGNAGMPYECSCTLKNDTIFVHMGFGMMGGFGFGASIAPKGFETWYYVYTDDVEPFTTDADTAASSHATVKGKYQSMVLDKNPSFKTGQQLTGYFTSTTQNIYEKQYDHTDTLYMRSRIYFTCKVKLAIK